MHQIDIKVEGAILLPVPPPVNSHHPGNAVGKGPCCGVRHSSEEIIMGQP